MRSFWTVAACVIVASASCGAAQTAPQPLVNPVGVPSDNLTALRPDSTVDDVLDALQWRGKTLKEFSADVKLSESDTVMGTTTERSGKVWFQSKPNDDARLRVRFDTKKLGAKPPQPDKKEYLLNNGWLIDRDYTSKNEVNRQISRSGEHVNLFQLGKGPFPLPIGQEKKDVHQQFDVTRLPPAKEDPANTIHLQLKPKDKSELAKKFSTIDVWVDVESKMPLRIETLDASLASDRSTDLENVTINPVAGLNDADFALEPIETAGWNRHDEPFDR